MASIIPWDDEHIPTRAEVATYLHGLVWEAWPTYAPDHEPSDYQVSDVVKAVLRGLSDVIYQQRRNFPDPDGSNRLHEAANAGVDTLLEEIGDAL